MTRRRSATDDHRIPALSICQPWAWMILTGHKRVENRTWPTRYRGPLVIHVSKTRRTWMHAAEGLRAEGFDLPADDDLTFGALCGIVELVDVVHFADSGLHADPFASGPLCWIVEQPRKLETPIPFRGNASLFYVDQSHFSDLLVA